MKIFMFGTGVINTLYGYTLAQAGNDVTHFVRKGKQDKFQDGVALDLLDERKDHRMKNVAKYALCGV